MIREAYKLVQADLMTVPVIEKVEITDQDGTSWRTAKRNLRQWFLAQASSLRKVRQKDYFNR